MLEVICVINDEIILDVCKDCPKEACIGRIANIGYGFVPSYESWAVWHECKDAKMLELSKEDIAKIKEIGGILNVNSSK